MDAILNRFLPIFPPFIPIIKYIFFTPCMKRHSLWNILLPFPKLGLTSATAMIYFPRIPRHRRTGILFDRTGGQKASQIHLIRRWKIIIRVLHGMFQNIGRRSAQRERRRAEEVGEVFAFHNMRQKGKFFLKILKLDLWIPNQIYRGLGGKIFRIRFYAKNKKRREKRREDNKA